MEQSASFLEDRLPGNSNKDLREVVRSAAAFLQAVKHRSTTTDRTPEELARDAGVATDTAIMLAHIVRRIDQTPPGRATRANPAPF